MTNVRIATLRSRRRTSRREEQLREMNIRCVPETKYDVRRVHMPGGWFLVERVTRRTGIPYVTLYDYPKRQPIRLAKGKENVVISFHLKNDDVVRFYLLNRDAGELSVYLRKKGFHEMPRVLRKVNFKPKHPRPIRELRKRGTTHSWGRWNIRNEH
jgi:hypothetical protein